MIAEFAEAVERVYREVSQALPPVEGNPCGSCRSCCTASIGVHRVGPLELAVMEYRLGQEQVARFRDYLARERDEQGGWKIPECPFLGPEGCRVHPFRPLSCRLYGQVRRRSARLFEHCVFVGQERVLPDEQEHLLSPGQVALTALNLEYLSYLGPQTGHSSGRVAEPQTDTEMASWQMVQGHYQEALALLGALRQASDSVTLMLMEAECLEALGRYQEALEVLEQALAERPRNPELWRRRGANLLWSGQTGPAVAAFQRSLELQPEQLSTRGLLGFAARLDGQWELAEASLRQAVAQEREPSPYRLQWGLVLQHLGRETEAREALELARELPSTREAAEQALELLTRGRRTDPSAGPASDSLGGAADP